MPKSSSDGNDNETDKDKDKDNDEEEGCTASPKEEQCSITTKKGSRLMRGIARTISRSKSRSAPNSPGSRRGSASKSPTRRVAADSTSTITNTDSLLLDYHLALNRSKSSSTSSPTTAARGILPSRLTRSANNSPSRSYLRRRRKDQPEAKDRQDEIKAKLKSMLGADDEEDDQQDNDKINNKKIALGIPWLDHSVTTCNHNSSSLLLSNPVISSNLGAPPTPVTISKSQENAMEFYGNDGSLNFSMLDLSMLVDDDKGPSLSNSKKKNNHNSLHSKSSNHKKSGNNSLHNKSNHNNNNNNSNHSNNSTLPRRRLRAQSYDDIMGENKSLASSSVYSSDDMDNASWGELSHDDVVLYGDEEGETNETIVHPDDNGSVKNNVSTTKGTKKTILKTKSSSLPIHTTKPKIKKKSRNLSGLGDKTDDKKANDVDNDKNNKDPISKREGRTRLPRREGGEDYTGGALAAVAGEESTTKKPKKKRRSRSEPPPCRNGSGATALLKKKHGEARNEQDQELQSTPPPRGTWKKVVPQSTPNTNHSHRKSKSPRSISPSPPPRQEIPALPMDVSCDTVKTTHNG